MVRKKIPLLIEKPLGIGNEPRELWDELLGLSQNTPVLVGYIFRQDRCAQHIKKMIDNGELGQILEVDFYCGSWLPGWRPGSDYRSCVSSQKSMGGGALLELSHEIDLALWFLNDLEINFSSMHQSGLLNVDVEDQVLLVGSSSNCSSITIRLNFCTRPPRRSFLLRSEKGEIEWDLLNGKVDVSIQDKPPQSFSFHVDSDDRFRLQANTL